MLAATFSDKNAFFDRINRIIRIKNTEENKFGKSSQLPQIEVPIPVHPVHPVKTQSS
jgi:hypothetical protein